MLDSLDVLKFGIFSNSIKDLGKIKDQAVLFLRGLLASMKQYYDEKQYQSH